ncbi:MAG: hypothetical protein UR48_C0057G0007, partial [Microgenomates group bacterium GW2011_GWD1_33_9]
TNLESVIKHPTKILKIKTVRLATFVCIQNLESVPIFTF